MLEISHINTFYDRIQALWDVSLSVNEAEIVALVGANGSGKSTLLDTVSGIIRPTSGSITFLEKKIDGIAPHLIVEMGLSHVPEGGRPFLEMSVRENLELGAYSTRLETKGRDAQGSISDLPHTQRKGETIGEDLKRRREANAGYGPRPDVQTKAMYV